jgi:colicin import membrane protein
MLAARYAPPPERFGIQALLVALVAHGFLIAALTWGTSWRSRTEITTASAELWAALPIQAAPALPPEAASAAEPIPEPPAATVAAKVPETIATKAPKTVSEIATAKIKPDPKPNPPPTHKDKPALSPKEHKLEDTRRKQAQIEAERVREQVRQDQIKRMAGMAGATGSASSTGQAAQSAAPSDSYSGRVKDRVKPNIVFPNVDSLPSNAAVEILIRLAPDGSVVLPLTISKSSGSAAFDRAVLRGIEKTETLPRDKDGRFPGPFTLVWRPRE